MIAQHERKASQNCNMEVFTKMEDSLENLESMFDISVPTYLGLMQKYPAARDDILNLRRSKNQALIGIVIIFSSLSFIVGFFIHQVI